MTHVITEPCIGSKDQSCVDVCPVDCIYEVERMLVIHPVECIDCGACIPECPVEAIFSDALLPEEHARFAAINAAITDGADAVDAALERAAAAPSPQQRPGR
jgi:ferredoxin